MRPAIDAKPVKDADPKHQARAARQTRLKTAKAGLDGKTFEDLTPKEKDSLLKQLAIQAGLINDSDDE